MSRVFLRVTCIIRYYCESAVYLSSWHDRKCQVSFRDAWWKNRESQKAKKEKMNRVSGKYVLGSSCLLTVPSVYKFHREIRACVTKRGDGIEDNQCTNIYSSITNKLTRKLSNSLPPRWSRANTFMYVFAERFRSTWCTFERRNEIPCRCHDTCH